MFLGIFQQINLKWIVQLLGLKYVLLERFSDSLDE